MESPESWQIKGGEDDRYSPTLDIWDGDKIVASICLEWADGRHDPHADAELLRRAPEVEAVLRRAVEEMDGDRCSDSYGGEYRTCCGTDPWAPHDEDCWLAAAKRVLGLPEEA